MNKVLVTGCNSGLGKFISDTIPNSIKLNRNNRHELLSDLKQDGVDLIIHCAFGFQGGYENNEITDYFKYIDDNILLTKDLVDIPHKKIVYISSLIVYNPNPINYKFTKLYSESIVETLGSNPLILRCPSMLGKDIKPNNLSKLIKDPNYQLSLTSTSEFNYILHSDILDFILKAYDDNIIDVVDFVSSDNVTFKEIETILGIQANFGNFDFVTPLVSNQKLISYYPKLNKTSKDVLKQFLNQL
jgi:nucleoside-diphosphate-sugar epimerase